MLQEPGVMGRQRGMDSRDIPRKVLVWVIIPGAVHVAVIFLLMHLQFLVAQAARREAVIDTSLEEIDIRDNPVEHLAPTNIKTSAVASQRLDWTALLRPDHSNLDQPDERNLVKMLEAVDQEPLRLVKIAVPAHGLSAIPKTGSTTESKTSVAAVVDELSRELAKILTQRNVLLVWLFDESGSMRQSQKEIRDRVASVYEELQGAAGQQAKLVSAVASYGKDTHLLLKEPSAQAAQVQAAIDRVPPDVTGIEHVMAGCRDVIRQYAPMARFQRRALVVFVVTDETGDDLEHLEAVVALAKAERARVFVLGGEAKFQQRHLWRRVPSPKAPDVLVGAVVDVGPEAAFPETLHGHDHEGGPAWQPPWTWSGFGFWALSRLAHATGGVYYVLHGGTGPQYDPEVMAAYAPELCSREEYLNRIRANRVRETIHRLHEFLAEVPLEGRIELSDLRGQLAAARRSAVNRIERLNPLIDILERGSLANDPHAPQRWEANRRLALADAYALRWSAGQFILAIDDFSRNPQLDRRAIRYGCGSHRNHPQRGGAPAAAARREAEAKYQDVIAHHPGTPWATIARRVRRLDTYAVTAVLPPTGGGTYTPPPPPPKL